MRDQGRRPRSSTRTCSRWPASTHSAELAKSQRGQPGDHVPGAPSPRVQGTVRRIPSETGVRASPGWIASAKEMPKARRAPTAHGRVPAFTSRTLLHRRLSASPWGCRRSSTVSCRPSVGWRVTCDKTLDTPRGPIVGPVQRRSFLVLLVVRHQQAVHQGGGTGPSAEEVLLTGVSATSSGRPTQGHRAPNPDQPCRDSRPRRSMPRRRPGDVPGHAEPRDPDETTVGPARWEPGLAVAPSTLPSSPAPRRARCTIWGMPVRMAPRGRG